MSGNSFGRLFRVTSFGESHGPAIGCVVDGVPPRLPLSRGRHPGLARPPAARPVPLHHAAARAGPGADPLRRVRGADHRRADRPFDRQRGRALEGLLGDQGPVPPRPRRLHLPAQVRHPRLPRRRPVERPRDGDAGGGRRRRPQGAGRGGAHSRGTGAGRPAPDRPRSSGTGTRSSATRSGARTRRRPRPGPRSSTRAQGGLVRRRHRRGGRVRACRPASASRCSTSSTPISPRR